MNVTNNPAQKAIRRHRMMQQDGMVAELTRDSSGDASGDPSYCLTVTKELAGSPVVIKQHIFKCRSNRAACIYMQHWLDRKFPVAQVSNARRELENLFSK